jgi:hypothetical protein
MVRKDYSARQKLRHWVFIVACISLLVGQASLQTQAAEQKHGRIHVFGKKLSDEEFYKLLNNELGNNRESLQVTIAACNAGGFAHKDFVKPHLQDTWSVTAAREVERGMSVEVEDNGEGNTMDVPIAHEQISTCAGDPDYDPAADLGGDGCVTDLDLSLVGIPVRRTIDINVP